MDARNDDTGALRIGGVVFSSDITPLWEGRDAQGRPNFFHALDQLPRLSPREYDPSRGYGTALHRAIQDGTARAIKYAAQIQAETGIDVDVDIVILTDGGNTDPPRDPKDTRMMIQGSDRSRVRHVFLYYQTVAGASDPSNYAVNELGIDPEQVQSFMAKPGETREQQAVRFRRLMQVMSSVTAGRNTSAVMAAALTDDTELV
jgi:hypothetical protein